MQLWALGPKVRPPAHCGLDCHFGYHDPSGSASEQYSSGCTGSPSKRCRQRYFASVDHGIFRGRFDLFAAQVLGATAVAGLGREQGPRLGLLILINIRSYRRETDSIFCIKNDSPSPP